MTTADRIEARWLIELQQLEALAARTDGRLRIQALPGGVDVWLRCRSPFDTADGGPRVRDAVHHVRIHRPAGWPEDAPLVQHRSPAGLLHPNVLYGPLPEAFPLPVGAVRGLVCYTHRWSSLRRLTEIVAQLYEMLGLRMGRYATDAKDCLQPAAVCWVNETLATTPELIPTERTPLVPASAPPEAHDAGQAGRAP